jgi:hypothetical protein
VNAILKGNPKAGVGRIEGISTASRCKYLSTIKYINQDTRAQHRIVNKGNLTIILPRRPLLCFYW